MALLHATVHAALKAPGIQVVALHVHHGLSPRADQWWAHVADQVAVWRALGWPVDFRGRRLSGAPRSGDSVEAWARAGRYEALREMAQEVGAGALLLAHHRLDQAETFLLQSLRGGGLAGLAAMPQQVRRDGLVWCRPWLSVESSRIQAYAQHHGLRWVDDESNADPRFARNRLRHTVWPALSQAFPSPDLALSDAASHAADAQACLQGWLNDALGAVCPDDPARLSVTRWRLQPEAAQRLLLKAWLEQRASAGVTQSLIRLLQADWRCRDLRSVASWPMAAGGGVLTLRRGEVQWAPRGEEPLPPVVTAVPCDDQHPLSVPVQCMQGARWMPRHGGELFQMGPGRPLRSLKKQFQSAGVPRGVRPTHLLFSKEGALMFVPGLGVDARAAAWPGSPRVRLVLGQPPNKRVN